MTLVGKEHDVVELVLLKLMLLENTGDMGQACETGEKMAGILWADTDAAK